MAASGPRDRRPAMWPYLVMPLVVLLVFWGLRTLHARAGPGAGAGAPAATSAGGAGPR